MNRFRWKQRDIHEKREARKARIAEYEATIATNAVLEPRLQTIANDLREGGPAFFSQLILRLKEQPSSEAPKHSPSFSYDSMIYGLLNKVFDEVVEEEKVPKDDMERMGPALSKHFEDHVAKLAKVTEEAKLGLAEDLAEQNRHITSEDIKVGWDSKVSFSSIYSDGIYLISSI